MSPLLGQGDNVLNSVRSIQGGVGLPQVPNGGSIYCTPMRHDCSNVLIEPSRPGVASEQDWQAKAHSFLSVSCTICSPVVIERSLQ